MIALCHRSYPTEEEIAHRGEGFYRDQDFHVSAGREYLVLGISFFASSTLYGVGSMLTVEDDYGHPSMAPATLFTLVDDRVSRHWVAVLLEDGGFDLFPASFKSDFFFDRLGDGKPEEVKEYKRVLALLRAEAYGQFLEVTPEAGDPKSN